MVAVVAVTGYHPINNSPDNPCEPAALSYTRTITLYKNYLLIVGLQVSWIQKSSLHVLTSSVITFTGKRTIIGSLTSPHITCVQATVGSDVCTAVSQTPGPCRSDTPSWGTWESTSAKLTQNQRYPCQSFSTWQVGCCDGVQSGPHWQYNCIIGNLITEARARIHDSDGGDKMVKKGSSIELNCTVESGDRAYNSLAVFWYLNQRAIDWQGQTGPGQGVQVSPSQGRDGSNTGGVESSYSLGENFNKLLDSMNGYQLWRFSYV